MNKSILAALVLGSVLTACSSKPSDFRPNSKVSVDNVEPGTRDTDYSNLGQVASAHEGAEHGHEAAAPAHHEAAADSAKAAEEKIEHEAVAPTTGATDTIKEPK